MTTYRTLPTTLQGDRFDDIYVYKKLLIYKNNLNTLFYEQKQAVRNIN